MKVNLAKSAGFCFGVKRALKIALDTTRSRKKIVMLGDIVHNEDVARQINKMGIKKIKKLSCGKGKTLLIRAHGAGTKIFDKAKRSGYNIIDATCPMVKEIHKIAKAMELKGYRIIIIGDKNHDEVLGIIGQLKDKAILIDKPREISAKKFKKLKKACIIVQSTQNMEMALRIVGVLKKYVKNLKFFNTICLPTRIKQEEIRKMPKENDAMVIIGSKTSANTRRLYEISKSLNKRTYWIESEKEINSDWFKNVKSVGVTAGASTPDYTTQKAIRFLNQIGRDS
ncbi:MAG: 4-hydroxy-3-methylbut-2-enyl diphosphate reductase [Candidatus Omnitrophica bacterium]|nr:4-hydroxy-3-methylbut-2-enyl diphosphate reductase [Candidatus Omnitrophota bacterium]